MLAGAMPEEQNRQMLHFLSRAFKVVQGTLGMTRRPSSSNRMFAVCSSGFTPTI